MSIEVKGKLVNLEIRRNGTTDPFKTMVCTEDSTFDITVAISKRQTNCGRKGAPGIPDFKSTLNAVQNVNPGALEMAYEDVKDFILNDYKADFRYISAADSSQGLGPGDGMYNYGSGYFSGLGASASAADGEVLTYSVELEGVGTLDNFDSES